MPRMYPPLYRYRRHYRAAWQRRQRWFRALVAVGVVAGVLATLGRWGY